jgi:pimeloyl-ACP methyl ester carboxylesterase
MIQEKTFDTGIVTINYAEGPPAGPPMVLLHGGGDRWQDFLPLFPSLATRWHVYALDMRGHGASGRVPGQYRPEQYVADIAAFLETRLTEPAVLFGHSLGGWVALLTAAADPDGVRALILGDPPLNIERFVAMESSEERVSMWQGLRALAAPGRSAAEFASLLADLQLWEMDPVGLRALAKSLSQADPDAIQYHAEGRIAEYVQNADPDAALRRVTCPTLLIQADPSRGGSIADDDAEHALSLLSDGLHVRLEGVGHDLGMSAWEVSPLLRAIMGFLESL